MTTRSVLISGASVAGPALAFWLVRLGFAVTIVEKAPALREGGYAVDFRGTSMEVLRRMGLLEAIHTVVPSIRREQLPEFVERYRAHYFRHDPKLEAFDGVPSMLDELADAGAWLAVATGKSRAGLDRALDQMGWTGRFLTTRCADEGAPKPDPWMLVDICEELELSPAQVLMVGDTTYDLGMARAAGADAIAVSYGAHLRAELECETCLEVVDSVAGLREALLGRIG